MAEANVKNNAEEEDIENEEELEDQNNNNTKDSNDDGGKKSSGSSQKSTKTFTQDQVNKMMTREKNQGRNSVYKELGIDPKDPNAISALKALIDSQKTEEQRAAEKEIEVQEKVNEAENRAMIAEAKAEAMMLGVKPQFVDDVVTLAIAKMTEDSELKTIIGEFKTKYPIWFGEDDDDNSKSKAGQKGTGSSVSSSQNKKDEEKGFGARLAAQRRNISKSNYWGAKK